MMDLQALEAEATAALAESRSYFDRRPAASDEEWARPDYATEVWDDIDWDYHPPSCADGFHLLCVDCVESPAEADTNRCQVCEHRRNRRLRAAAKARDDA